MAGNNSPAMLGHHHQELVVSSSHAAGATTATQRNFGGARGGCVYSGVGVVGGGVFEGATHNNYHGGGGGSMGGSSAAVGGVYGGIAATGGGVFESSSAAAPKQSFHGSGFESSAATPQQSFHCGGSGSTGGVYNGIAAGGGVFESASTGQGFQPNLHGISVEWTPEEQDILDEGMIQFSSESNIVRYAKIAVQLKNKTVRDVALRCKWLAKRDHYKRRKEDLSFTRKGKERKDKVSDPSATSSYTVMQRGLAAYSQGGMTNYTDAGMVLDEIGGITGQLIRQNAQAFEQIAANLATHQIQDNIGLFCRARDNLLQILGNLSDQPNTLTQMSPLPAQINVELANLILPASSLQML